MITESKWELKVINEDEKNWYTNCVGGCGHVFASSKIIGVPVGNPLDGVIEYVAGSPRAMMCMDCKLGGK